MGVIRYHNLYLHVADSLSLSVPFSTHTHTHTHTHTQHSLDDVVNLGAFSCLEDVLVQYAAVNKYGRSSRWSPSAEIDVYGGKREKRREREREREREPETIKLNQHTCFHYLSKLCFLSLYTADGIPSPENPNRETIRFVVRPDQRFGFWKHGVVSVYWDRPRGFHYISHYTVTLHPSSLPCGRRQIILNIPRVSEKNIVIWTYILH